jgi:hypothetical protein
LEEVFLKVSDRHFDVKAAARGVFNSNATPPLDNNNDDDDDDDPDNRLMDNDAKSLQISTIDSLFCVIHLCCVVDDVDGGLLKIAGRGTSNWNQFKSIFWLRLLSRLNGFILYHTFSNLCVGCVWKDARRQPSLVLAVFLVPFIFLLLTMITQSLLPPPLSTPEQTFTPQVIIRPNLLCFLLKYVIGFVGSIATLFVSDN